MSKEVKHIKSNTEHELVFESEFLSVRKNEHYMYAERKGIDSVAFILIANNISDERRIGVIHEKKPPIDRYITSAFGGSIDKEHYKEDLRVLVQDEVLEESGFTVDLDSIEPLGRVFCSTQMDQFVYLFAVRVNKTEQGTKTTTDTVELGASVTWFPTTEVFEMEDWKAPLIVSKLLLSQSAGLTINKKG